MNRWESPPGQIFLDGRTVDVWLVDADDRIGSIDSLWAMLPQAEQERAARFKFEKDRRLFVIAHGALRSILSAYRHIAGESLAFVEGPNGKPSLADAPAGLEFNLSHSHQMALLAVSLSRQVGVDIEYVKREFTFDEVAERFFTAREVGALRGLPAELQRQAFFKCWTSKEACLKAKGQGLSGKLDEVEITLTSDRHVQIGARVPGWSLIELDPGDDYVGALVIEGDAAPLRCYRWQPPLPV